MLVGGGTSSSSCSAAMVSTQAGHPPPRPSTGIYLARRLWTAAATTLLRLIALSFDTPAPCNATWWWWLVVQWAFPPA